MSEPHLDDKGKELIFKEIYVNHFKKVESFAYKYLQDGEKAQEVAQDVFVSVWENMEKLWQGRDVVPFLFVITKFKCLNVLRKESRGQAYVSHTQYHTRGQIACTALESSTLDTLLSKEVGRLIQNAFAKMPVAVKETFELSRNRELKYYQIAQEQNISVKTVEYRMSYAFKILRENLKDYLVFLAAIIINRFI